MLKEPKLISGLPGSGYVGKLAVDYLIDQLSAQKFADIYSSSFPPQVLIQPDGTVDLTKNSLYFCKAGNNDLVLLTGDAQPVSAPAEYALSEKLIELCQRFNIDAIYTLAAYITGKFSHTPRVYGTSTSLDVVKDFSNNNVSSMTRGSITGMNGVLLGFAKKATITGICLLGETSGYVIDAKASKAVLEVLLKMLNFQLDMSELNKRAQDTEQIIKSIESQAASSQISPRSTPMQAKDEKNLDYIS